MREVWAPAALLFVLCACGAGQKPAADSIRSSSPVQTEWERATPGEVGLENHELDHLTADIRAGKYVNIHSLLVARNGRLAWEAYFEGEDERRGEPLGVVTFTAETLHDARSITKSVVASLVGLAIAEGAIAGTDEPVAGFFPGLADQLTDDHFGIRLRDLLSMTSGLRWDEESVPYGDARNSETAMDLSPDPIRYVLGQPVVHPPGSRFEYSGGDTTVLAAVLERAVGMPLDAYAEKALFAPLGIDRYEWLTFPDGTPMAASGLRLLPRDMAKLGQVYLDEGLWCGVRILPRTWIAETLTKHAQLAPRPTGFQHYGYHWWLGTARVGDDYVPFSAAVGWGGQRILIVESMDLVAVVTAGLYGDRRQTDITFEILLDRLLPAISDF